MSAEMLLLSPRSPPLTYSGSGRLQIMFLDEAISWLIGIKRRRFQFIKPEIPGLWRCLLISIKRETV